MNPLPLTRARLIQAGVEIDDWRSARDWLVARVAAALVIGGAAVASAVAEMLPL